MRRKTETILLALALACGAGVAAAQAPPAHPNPGEIYCSGMVTSESVPRDTYLISGEGSHYRMGYTHGEYVYINKGAGAGVKVGDKFSTIRPISDSWRWKWFASQPRLRRAMGQQWTDVAQMSVVVVHPNVSIAQVIDSCTDVRRGDIVLPFTERPVPALKTGKFDHFAPVSGKPVGMLVSSMDFETELVGMNQIVYINLGSAQGVKVGDFVRIFRYQGTRHDKVYDLNFTAYKMYGYGSTPVRYTWKDLPREVIGEGVVLRSSPNASTVLITFSLYEMYMGNYVEIE